MRRHQNDQNSIGIFFFSCALTVEGIGSKKDYMGLEFYLNGVLFVLCS